MANFFQHLFGKSSSQPTAPQQPIVSDDPQIIERDRNPMASAGFKDREEGTRVAATALDEPEAEREYEEFRATFCHKLGENFIEEVTRDGATRLLAWLDWRNPEAEPKAIIRLLLAMIGRGENLWDQSGIGIFLEGRWSRGGGPSDESQKALSVLAQWFKKPITIYYRPTPDGDLHVMQFDP